MARKWYVIFPDCCGWIAVAMDENVRAMIEECNAEVHLNANDRFAPIVKAILDGRTDGDVDPETCRAACYAAGVIEHEGDEVPQVERIDF